METWTSLQTLTQNYCANDQSSTTLTFLQNELNRAKTFVFKSIGDYVTQRSRTTTSVTSQQYYHVPIDCADVEGVKATIGGVDYVLEPIDSQKVWDDLNAVTFSGTAIPKYYFKRKRDFGVWPIPQDTSWTITFIYQLFDRDMQYADYSTGTVTVTNNSQTLTGSGVAFDNTFVGRWFKTNTDGFWYKISAYNSSTSLTLETSFDGNTASGQTYIIGDSSDLPDETHPLFAMRAACFYYSGFKANVAMAQFWDNMFWTGDGNNNQRDGLQVQGGFLRIIENYATRTTDLVIHRHRTTQGSPADILWAYKVTG